MRSMKRGYFTPPVLIILAIIIFAVALSIAINTDLVKKLKKEPSPTPNTSLTTQQSSPIPGGTANWKTYTDLQNGFSLKHSADWTAVVLKGKEEPEVLKLTKADSVISVIVFPTDMKSLDEFLGPKKEGSSVYRVTEKRRYKIDSVEVEYKMQEVPYNNEGDVSIIAIATGRVYQIIFPFNADNKSQIGEFDKILSTFQFTD